MCVFDNVGSPLKDWILYPVYSAVNLKIGLLKGKNLFCLFRVACSSPAPLFPFLILQVVSF